MATTPEFSAVFDLRDYVATRAAIDNTMTEESIGFINMINAQETQRRIDADERQIFSRIFDQINAQLMGHGASPLSYVEATDIRRYIQTSQVRAPSLCITYRRRDHSVLHIDISLGNYRTTLNIVNRETDPGHTHIAPRPRIDPNEFTTIPIVPLHPENVLNTDIFNAHFDRLDVDVRPARYPVPHPDYPNGDETRNYLRLTVWNRIKKAIDQWLPKATLSTQFIPGQIEGEIKVAGYTIAWINAVSRRLSRIMLPEGATKKDLNLIRYRLRQIGLRVKATGRHEVIIHQVKPTDKPILERLYYGKVYIIPDYHEISFNKPVEVIKPPTQLTLGLPDTRNTKKTLDDLFGSVAIPQKAFYQDFLNTYAMGTVTATATSTATMGLTRFTSPYTTR